MPDRLRLVGRTIVEVRKMTAEELEREGWEGREGGCIVLDNGAILYPSSGSGTSPGRGFAQFAGQLWAVRPEAEVPITRGRYGPNLLLRVERAALVSGLVFVAFSLTCIALGIAQHDGLFTQLRPLFGMGAIGQAVAAAVSLSLWSLVRAARRSTL